MERLLIRNARVATMSGAQREPGHAPLGLIEDGAVACEGERIVYAGRTAGAPEGESIDAGGRLLTPGFVDPHTHLVFAGDRAHEHALRLAGASYLQIAEAGGGIRSTVRSTRAASDEELLRSAQGRLRRLARSGVTTVEVKTGYGLSIAEELRQLRIARDLGPEAGCRVVPTLLGLHAVPGSGGAGGVGQQHQPGQPADRERFAAAGSRLPAHRPLARAGALGLHRRRRAGAATRRSRRAPSGPARRPHALLDARSGSPALPRRHRALRAGHPRRPHRPRCPPLLGLLRTAIEAVR